MLAKSLGAKVYPNGIKEIGWYDIELTEAAKNDRLFAPCRPREPVFQWHGDTFDLPTGAVHLAHSPVCKHQAFRYGNSAWALQFHWEVTSATIEDWLGEDENCGEVAELDYIDPAAIRRATPTALPFMQQTASPVFARFAELCKERL